MRSTARVISLSTILLFTACASTKIDKVQSALLQKDWTTVMACAGVPAKTLDINDQTKIAEWDYDENKVSSSLSLGAISSILTPILAAPSLLISGDQFSVSGDGNCKIIAEFVDNKLISLKFGGDNTTIFTGHEGVCEPVLRGCLP